MQYMNSTVRITNSLRITTALQLLLVAYETEGVAEDREEVPVGSLVDHYGNAEHDDQQEVVHISGLLQFFADLGQWRVRQFLDDKVEHPQFIYTKLIFTYHKV